jgi:hypothetical protein
MIVLIYLKSFLEKFEPISKIADHAKGRGANRFKNGAYTLVFEYFESVCNKAHGR